MIVRPFVFITILVVGFAACDLMEEDMGEGAVARVSDKYLYLEDIGDLRQKMAGDKDSATIVGNYINSWIQQELLLEKAELNLREDQKDFQKLLEDYRRSLIIYAFQKEWIKYNLDTLVGEEEIAQYYDSNKANFELKENIVKCRYVVVPKNAPKLKDLDKMIKASGDEYREEFRDYCIQYASIYNENDSTWLLFDEVLAQVPLDIPNKEDFLQRNTFATSVDSVNLYMIQIRDYKIKNATSPLSFEEERIRSIIINQRKLELLATMKDQLFRTSLEKGRAEIYDL